MNPEDFIANLSNDYDFTSDLEQAINSAYSKSWGPYIDAMGKGALTAAPMLAKLVSNQDSNKLESLERNKRLEALNLASTQFEGDNSTLLAQSRNLPMWQNVTMDDFGGSTDVFGAGVSGALQGALAGAKMGGSPWGALAGAAAQGVLGAVDAYKSNVDKRNRMRRVNALGLEANNYVRDNFNAAVGLADKSNDRFKLQNYFNNNLGYAFGGVLETNGATFPTNIEYIDSGSTHERNPYGGVQVGIASDGMPNLVEEGEVIIDVPDSMDDAHIYADGGNPNTSKYVLSNRVKPNKRELESLRLITNKPEKYEGQSYASIYKDIIEKNGIKELVNRQDIRDYLSTLNKRISEAQEATKLREQQEEILQNLKNASPSEQDYIMQQFGINPFQSMGEQPTGDMYSNEGVTFQEGGFEDNRPRVARDTDNGMLQEVSVTANRREPVTIGRVPSAYSLLYDYSALPEVQPPAPTTLPKPNLEYPEINRDLKDSDLILPMISGATVLSDMLGVTNTPDYSNIDAINRASRLPNLIGYTPNGRYVRPVMSDTNYITNELNNQNLRNLNLIRDLSSGNSATALAQLANQNYAAQQSIGDIRVKIHDANQEALQKAVESNNKVDANNAAMALSAAEKNQAAINSYNKELVDIADRYATLREKIDEAVAANRSANWNNFLENLEGYFENQRARDMANKQYSVYGYRWNSKDEVEYDPTLTKTQKEKAKKKAKKEEESNN